MKVHVQRYDPDMNRHWLQTYEVDCSKRSMTVQDLLEEIAQTQDPSLGFFRHSICNHGICARCILSVNGKNRLACVELVQGHEELFLAPASTRHVIRDLISVEAGKARKGGEFA